MLHQRCHILAEQRKRWISRNDIGFIKQRQAFGGTKITIPIKLGQLVLMRFEKLGNVEHIHAAVARLVIDACHNCFIRLVSCFSGITKNIE